MSDRRIYVACLASYNAGRLHGVWIDLAGKDAEDVQSEIQAMLAASPTPGAEEWAVHDSEGLGNVGEHEDLADLCALADALEEHGDIILELKAHGVASDLAGTIDYHRDNYEGAWKDEEAFADSLIDEGALGDIPDLIKPYIDVEKFARDLFMGDYFSIDLDGETHVYRSA